MEKLTFTLPKRYEHNEKGRPPLNEREAILDAVAKATNTTIGRWVRYDQNLLQRCLITLQEKEKGTVRNKAAYYQTLLEIYGKD